MIAASLLEQTLNRLLRQTPGAAGELARHAGQSVQFDLGLAAFDFRIADDGLFSETASEAPDATLRPTAAMLARLPFFGREALRAADGTGDAQLLATLDRVFKRLDFDLAAALAPYLGDLAAERAAGSLKQAGAAARRAGEALGVNLAEYLVEEAQLLARGVDVARFAREVDELADAAARLEARIRRLEA